MRFEVVATGQHARYEADEVDGRPRILAHFEPMGRATIQQWTIGLPPDRVRDISEEFRKGAVLVAVFQGGQRTGGHSITVDRIVVAGARVDVMATLRRPGPEEMVTQALTSPFQVVALEGADLPSGALTFVLFDQAGQEVARTTIERR